MPGVPSVTGNPPNSSAMDGSAFFYPFLNRPAKSKKKPIPAAGTGITP